MSQLSAKNINFNQVKITDKFFTYYQNLVMDHVIPYQWKVLNDELEDVEKSSAIKNFQIAAKEREGNFYGFVFQDSDVYKWLEAVGYSLHLRQDEALERCADEVIDLIGRAQQEDGYINTYFTIERPDLKFKNLWECHELYCAGHFFEAAVAYYNATGKDKVIKIAQKLADCIDQHFGPEEEKLKGYDGHEEVELGLMALYSVIKEKRYLDLAKFFIDERGKEPYFFDQEWERRGRTSFWNGWKECNAPSHKKNSIIGGGREYNQTHKPVREQDEVVGHAVRVVYMLCGMADIAREANDLELLEACHKLWDNIVDKKMYITGAIGSTHMGEAFTGPYDLPNDYVYGETCASIGMAMFAKRMLNNKIDSKYADIVEKEIYNGIISGISMDGQSFFYVNPLEVYPNNHTNPVLEAVKVERQKWYPCACCPPNVARFLLNLGDYIYSQDTDIIYIHQYLASKTTIDSIDINLDCDILNSNQMSLTLHSQEKSNYTIAFRIPQWTNGFSIKVNQVTMHEYKILDGYVYLMIDLQDETTIRLVFNTQVKLMKANAQVRHDAGKIAVSYGPVVYCLEEVDNGDLLYNLVMSKQSNSILEKFEYNGLQLTKIKMNGYKEIDRDNSLYHSYAEEMESKEMTFIPYHFWGNRGIGEMQVWVRYN